MLKFDVTFEVEQSKDQPALIVHFCDALVNDSSSVYAIFFTDDKAGRNFNTQDAICLRTSESYKIVSKERLSNIVTIETETPHGFQVGQHVELVGVLHCAYIGKHVIQTIPGPNAFTYECEGEDDMKADASGTVWKLMAGPITSESITLSYDYDANDQRGRSSVGVDAPFTIAALGMYTIPVTMTGLIQKYGTNVVCVYTKRYEGF